MIKRFILSIICLLIAVTSYADTAKQVDFLLSGYRHPTTDEVLSGGKVWVFLDNTTTMSPLYTDKDQGGTAANPVILDSSGKAEVYGATIYKFVIYDSNDVLIETLDGLEYITMVDGVADGLAQLQPEETMADLRAISYTPADGQEVSILGYYARGDGVDNRYYWDNSNTAPDNGGSIIKVTSITTGRWLATHTSPISFVDFGCIGDGVADDSAAIQVTIDASAEGTVINGFEDKIFYCSEIDIAKKLTIQNVNFKHKRNDELQNETTWTTWFTGVEVTTGQETSFTITADGVILKNVDIDGNGVPYSVTSVSGYANGKVIMIDVHNADNVMLDNVNIHGNNAIGVYVYGSEYVTFQNGSILDSIGISGSQASHEQILLDSSRHCKILNSEIGGMSAWSAIATNGGFLDIDSEDVVGGYIPYNTATVDNSRTSSFGEASGASDTYHIIDNNVVRSTVIDANEAGGGGVLGRMVTINSGRCTVSNNVVYDITNLSQGGIGLGHEQQKVVGQIAYGVMASRTDVFNNEVFGFRKPVDNQGWAILSGGSEEVTVHHNKIYNCNTGIYHARYAINSSYTYNDIWFNDRSFEVQDTANVSQSHGLYSKIKIVDNSCIGNLQEIIMDSPSSYTEYDISDNFFLQSEDVTTEEQFSLRHGTLKFNRNTIINYSTGPCASFDAGAVGKNVDFSGNTISSMVESATPDIVLFEGDAATRGSLKIEGLTIDVLDGVSSYNRRLRITDESIKDNSISDLLFTNCYLSLNTGLGDVSIEGGTITTQGTAAPLSISVNTVGVVSMVTVSDVQFPAFGSATATATSITAAAGWIIYNNCTTKEDKEISDRVNGNQIQSNDCYKVTAGNLTASRP